jgi:nuclear transport factor 2 (NTF2) superfamily protein
MILSAHQPSYLPWLGYINKIANCDLFISMDDVKFSKNSMYAKNYIILNNKKFLLSVPIINSTKNNLIKDVEICGKDWKKDHLVKIKLAYKNSNFYSNFIECFEKIYFKEWKWLADLNHEILFYIKNIFKIKTEIKIASNYNFTGNKNEKLINYCKQFNANKYIFGKNGKSYADECLFYNNNISIIFQDFQCPNNNLSFIDYLFNYGDKL